MPKFSFRNVSTDARTELTGTSPFDVSGLLPEGTYAVSAMSDEAAQTITIAAAATVPGQVTGLTVTPGDAEAVLAWSAPADGGSPITDYVIELDTGGGFAVVADGTGAATGYTHAGLANDVLHSYRVSAVNAVGQGPASAVVAATPTAPFEITDNGDGTFSFANYDGSSFTVDIDGTAYGPFSFDPTLLQTGPVNLIAPLATGAATAGETASATSGVWVFDETHPAPTFGYQWQLDGADIAGATAASYVTEAAGSLTCDVTATQSGSGVRTEPSNALTIASAGITAEANMAAHWIFGTDNPTNADLKAGATLTAGPAGGAVSTDANSLLIQGTSRGYLTGIMETADFTFCAVVRRNGTTNNIFGGTLVRGQVPGWTIFSAGESLNIARDGSDPVVDVVMPADWVFIGVSIDTAGNCLYFRGDQTGSVIQTVSEARGQIGVVEQALGGVHYDTPFPNDFNCAELMLSNGATDSIEMEAIYQRSIARMSDRSIVLV